MLSQTIESHSRLLARIVRDLLARESFDTLADLTDALKGRLGRLRIRWTNENISDAYSLIASNRPLVGECPSPITRTPDALAQGQPVSPPTHAEAVQILRQLQITVPLRRMPEPRPDNPRAADRLIALRIVVQEITASIARCEALEVDAAEARK